MAITKQLKIERRKTYSLDPVRSKELAQFALDISNQIGRVVPRQEILDALVFLLRDHKTNVKVGEIIEKK